MATWLFAVQLILVLPAVSSLQCISPSGKPVDWFIVYKLPKLPKNDNPMLEEGLGHFYMDVKSPEWVLSEIPMNKPKHAVYNTLQQIYKSKQRDSLLYLMYNDEDPNGEVSFTHGHTKGVVAFDKKQGFWLVHSTPRFPPRKEKGYDWPHNAYYYGQSFLCVTFDYKMLNGIGKQLLYNYPRFHDKQYTSDYLDGNPDLRAAVEGTQPTGPPWTSEILLTSSGGTKFTSFAKFVNYERDLYESLLAPTFKSDLFVETWQHGGTKKNLQTDCSGLYKVFNVKEINLPDGISFSEYKDHSKWAVSQNKTNWVCIGDINRQVHQEERAGGTVCFQNKNVWRGFDQAVGMTESCPKTSTRHKNVCNGDEEDETCQKPSS